MPPARLTYPTDRLLAVLDDPAAVPGAVDRLTAEGIPAADVSVLGSADAAGGMAGLGSPGLLARLVRLVQFTTMDQMPDFRLYEAAIAAGRAVVAVRASDRTRALLARDVLVAAGAHFINRYGRFSTEELSRWQGPELELPGYLRR